MRLPWRREKVPENVRSAIDLQSGERVLAAAKGSGESSLVASDRALYVVPGGMTPGGTSGSSPAVADLSQPAGVRRIRWDLIDRAVWQPPRLLLELRADETSAVTSESLEVDPSGQLPAVVRDRVENSIVVNSRVAVAGGHARVLARRNPDTARLLWRVVFGAGVDAQDPDAQEAARRAMADLRSRLGV